LQLVLDSNEYLFALGAERKPACETLLNALLKDPATYRLRISRTILEEIRRNTAPQRFRDLWLFLHALGVSVDEDWEVSFELGVKYESMGLKPGDAFIAAYTEWTGAECLVTENRDFLALTSLPFKIVRAEEFLKQHRA
jgi:predicted nucleic acid-binding protein